MPKQYPLSNNTSASLGAATGVAVIPLKF